MLDQEEILGVKVNTGLEIDDAISIIEERFLKNSGSHFICTTNPEFIIDAQKDTDFKNYINSSDLSLPDGSGILYALEYKKRMSGLKKSVLFPILAFIEGLKLGMQGIINPDLLGKPISGRLLAEKLCELSAQKGYTVFFLGGWPKDKHGRDITVDYDLATRAAENIRRRFPNVHIVGSTSQFRRQEQDDAATLAYIKNCMKKENIDHIDIILVAYNHVFQEKWLKRNIDKIPAKVGVGVGSTLDYFAVPDALSPRFVHYRNLYWFFRLITEPWRYKRIMKAFPEFPLKVFLNTLKTK